MRNMQRTWHSRYTVTLVSAVAVIVLLAVGVVVYSRTEKGRRMYYAYKAQTAFASQNRKLGEPLRALGFTEFQGGVSQCDYIEKYGYDGKTLDCSVVVKSYKVFSDEASKARAVNAAKELSSKLDANGWRRGNYEIGAWFRKVTDGGDSNADAYYHMYNAKSKTFCVLDFFVAYSHPEPSAVSVTFSCTVPESHPPVDD